MHEQTKTWRLPQKKHITSLQICELLQTFSKNTNNNKIIYQNNGKHKNHTKSTRSYYKSLCIAILLSNWKMFSSLPARSIWSGVCKQDRQLVLLPWVPHHIWSFLCTHLSFHQVFLWILQQSSLLWKDSHPWKQGIPWLDLWAQVRCKDRTYLSGKLGSVCWCVPWCNHQQPVSQINWIKKISRRRRGSRLESYFLNQVNYRFFILTFILGFYTLSSLSVWFTTKEE